ncbi:uncharacterized protein Tco025E_09491 [Trypanosoma conorhini]|uniref:Uncharacterized protein n=1 Tax=Trypanosoma conorhini TaxID=83891 RepID=A0A422MVP1_9TRYP|nr:uncharacterized protein Tco025E_09491 [Trypanosoma conorhini]RNE97305.1 hypothetical protein Tco025E_09491 [Trypanosoma conorhini]
MKKKRRGRRKRQKAVAVHWRPHRCQRRLRPVLLAQAQLSRPSVRRLPCSNESLRPPQTVQPRRARRVTARRSRALRRTRQRPLAACRLLPPRPPARRQTLPPRKMAQTPKLRRTRTAATRHPATPPRPPRLRQLGGQAPRQHATRRRT